jgi:DNA polymerase III delta subunit
MVYLFLGIDEISKERKIQQLKKELLKSNQEVFDYDRLHAKELTPASLKESIQRLPVFAKKRLIFIRDIEKLDVKCKEIILSLIKKPNSQLEVILDTQITQLKDPFLRKIANSSKVLHFGSSKILNTFDLADAIERKNASEALRIFSTLYKKGEHPTRILGGLVWSWRNMKGLLRKDSFGKGIEFFLETDTNIKFSRLKPEMAMEILIIKLCLLTGG